MELSEDAQINHGPGRHPIDHWGVGLLEIHLSLLHASTGTQAGFVFDETPIWSPISLEGIYRNDGILPF